MTEKERKDKSTNNDEKIWGISKRIRRKPEKKEEHEFEQKEEEEGKLKKKMICRYALCIFKYTMHLLK